MTLDLIIVIIVNVFTLGVSSGIVISRLKMLEKKQDKHNNLVERVTTNECDIFSTKGDIEEIKKDISAINGAVNSIKLTCASRGAD